MFHFCTSMYVCWSNEKWFKLNINSKWFNATWRKHFLIAVPNCNCNSNSNAKLMIACGIWKRVSNVCTCYIYIYVYGWCCCWCCLKSSLVILFNICYECKHSQTNTHTHTHQSIQIECQHQQCHYQQKFCYINEILIISIHNN